MKGDERMTDNELLLAISNMMDEKLDAKLDEKLDEKLIPITNRLDRMDERLERVEDRLERVEDRLERVEDRLERVEGDVTQQKTNYEQLHNRVRRVEVDLLENRVIPQLNTIESCYLDTYERYMSYTEKLEGTFTDVELLKKVVSEHSGKLQMIS